MSKKPKKCHANIITEAEAAAFNFKPWQQPIDYEKLPPNEAFAKDGLGHLVTCRCALVTMYKTKTELVEALGEMGNEDRLAMMDGFLAAKSFFSHFSTLIDAASARIICAESSYLQGVAAADRSLRKIVRNHEMNNSITSRRPKEGL